jgi:hypothetical protein
MRSMYVEIGVVKWMEESRALEKVAQRMYAFPCQNLVDHVLGLIEGVVIDCEWTELDVGDKTVSFVYYDDNVVDLSHPS